MSLKSALTLLVTLTFLLTSLSGCTAPELPPEPPSIAMSLGNQSTPMHKGAPSWIEPVQGQTQQWPPLLPKYPLFVLPGDEVGFAISGIGRKPVSLRLDVWGQDQLYQTGGPVEPMYSKEFKETAAGKDGIFFSWTVPELGTDIVNAMRYGVGVTAVWEDGNKRSEAQYFGALSLASAKMAQAVFEVPSRFFQATWAGSVDEIKALTVPEHPWETSTWDFYNPFYMGLDGSLDSLSGCPRAVHRPGTKRSVG